METTGDPRLPNKLQADLWALPAARKCSLSHLSGPNGLLFAVNPFSPELSTERPRLKSRRRKPLIAIQ